MAEAFLAGLPNVGRGVLGKEDQQCPICREEYGTVPSTSGTIERAVRLPCNHVIGSECISIWVKQTGGATENNTCPMCRHVLFPSWARAEAEHARIHTVLSNRCEHLCTQLDLRTVVMRMARCIANRFHDRVEIGGLDSGDGPAHMIAAASIYMASYLLDDVRSLDLVSSCDGLEVEEVRRVYGLLYGYRHELISMELLARAGREWEEVEEILPSFVA